MLRGLWINSDQEFLITDLKTFCDEHNINKYRISYAINDITKNPLKYKLWVTDNNNINLFEIRYQKLMVDGYVILTPDNQFINILGHELRDFCNKNNLLFNAMKYMCYEQSKIKNHKNFNCRYYKDNDRDLIKERDYFKKISEEEFRKIHDLYHIKQKKSYPEIDNIMGWVKGTAFYLKSKYELPTIKHFYYRERNFNETQINFLDNFKKNIEYYHHELKYSVETISNMFDLSASNILYLMREHNLKLLTAKMSNAHNIIINELQNLNIGIIINDRKIINPKELDIVIPSINTAIEINGLYYHDERFIPNDYHLNKQNLTKEQGYDLLHFWDIEINEKRNICLNIIKSRLGLLQKLNARDLNIKQVNYKLIESFLNDNHIQGSNNTNINYILFDINGNIKSSMTFKKHKKYDYEMARFCTLNGFTIRGGAEKLFKHFIADYKPKSVITYADKRLFTGKVYEKLGFNYLHESVPNYYYFKIGYPILYSRNKFQKHKLPKLLQNFDPNLTEVENMKNHGYTRVFDCGNKVFLYTA